MKIILPKTSGFCYGVSLAVKEAENIINSKKKLIMYGEPVHNPDVVGRLKEKGAVIVESVDEVQDYMQGQEAVLLIRAHGISKKEEDNLRNTGIVLSDKTCPKVKKVHETVKEEEKKGRRIIIVGNPGHPEVKGIVGQCKTAASVISSAEEAELLELKGDISVVVQTTFNSKIFQEIKKIIEEKNKDAVIYNTMCPATNIRQKEIEELSKTADYVIVLGGKKSSNSLKLCQIAARNTSAVLVEKIEDLSFDELDGKNTVVVCGGSSTPYELIDQATKKLLESFGGEIVNLKDKQ